MPQPNQMINALQAHREFSLGITTSISPSQVYARRLPLEKPVIQVDRSLPGGWLLLGQAEDGKPIMLNLYDPTPGPLLVAGDCGSGKTAFLHSLAHASNIQNPGDIQFGVLTPFPEEWTGMEGLPNCLGVWPVFHSAARDFLSQMVSWADVLPGSSQAVLLLIDGLDLSAAGGYRVAQDLRWVVMNGPEKQIWPVVAVNPGRLTRLDTWVDCFQTRILGQVKNPQTASLLISDKDINLASLNPGRQFGLWRPQMQKWLPFSPSLLHM